MMQHRFLILFLFAKVSHCLQVPLGGTKLQNAKKSNTKELRNYKAAVIVPGFLTGENDFKALAQTLSERGVPSVVVPMPEWHWLPCVGGRSMRPMLERIAYTVQHVCATLPDDPRDMADMKQPLVVPPFKYSLLDCFLDFMENPGGVFNVGGSDEVDEYPQNVHPHGLFPPPTNEAKGKIAIIGHSAGGWISRVYLSNRNYGGKSYNGTDLVHSLVTLGTPHADAPGPAFKGVEWCNREPLPVRGLAIGSIGFPGNNSGDLTKNSYSFCNPESDGSDMDGDSMTPIESSLAMDGEKVDKKTLENVMHYPWSDAGVWGHFFAPELTADHKDGKPWYGDGPVVDQWIGFLTSVK